MPCQAASAGVKNLLGGAWERDLAAGYSASQEAELAELRLIADHSRLIGEACARVLDGLGGTPARGA
jgi:hypothetical protein